MRSSQLAPSLQPSEQGIYDLPPRSEKCAGDEGVEHEEGTWDLTAKRPFVRADRRVAPYLQRVKAKFVWLWHPAQSSGTATSLNFCDF